MAEKQKKDKKWLYWLLMLVLFVAAAVIVYLVWNTYFKDKDEEQNSGATVETIEIEEHEEPQRQEEVEIPNKPKVVQYDGEDPNSAEELSGVITYAGFNDDRLMIRVNIDQYIDDGECRLDLMRGGVLIHEEVTGIVGNVSTASCDGFDVPVDIVGEGAVEIEIHLDSDGKTGIIKGEADV